MSNKKDLVEKKILDDKKDIKKPIDNELLRLSFEKYNYPSVDKLYKILKSEGNNDITRKDIKNFLEKNEVQQLKESKESKLKDGHIIAVSPNVQYQLDIYYMMKYHKKNKGFKYILALIDIFTRQVYVEKMKTKEVDEVIKSLDKLFQKSGYPFVITSDSDSTFLSDECQAYFKKHEINHNTVPIGDHKSLGLIDRFARTLKTILHKRFLIHNTTNWIDVIDTIVDQYNNTPHSGIDDIAPNDATLPDNLSKIVELNNEKREDITTFKNDFEVGDKVRIKITDPFHKKTEGIWSDEIYTIKKVFGKTVILDNDMIKRYDTLLKVHDDDDINVINQKSNPIKQAKKDYKNELFNKREDLDEDNIIKEKRIINKPKRYLD